VARQKQSAAIEGPPLETKPGRKPRDPILRTLWRGNLQSGSKADHFLFRSTEDFGEASRQAEELIETSAAASIAGSRLIGIERVARLWN
jgi:hypothetical protein